MLHGNYTWKCMLQNFYQLFTQWNVCLSQVFSFDHISCYILEISLERWINYNVICKRKGLQLFPSCLFPRPSNSLYFYREGTERGVRRAFAHSFIIVGSVHNHRSFYFIPKYIKWKLEFVILQCANILQMESFNLLFTLHQNFWRFSL